jgi:predicted Na+-dependent transporter
VSANVDSPFGSMAISLLVIVLVPLMIGIGLRFGAPQWIDYFNYVMPWRLKYHLLHPSIGHVLGAAAACVGYTALYLGLGLVTFNKRDL